MENINSLQKAIESGVYGSKFEVALANRSAEVLINFLNKKNVLELGCGFGFTTAKIAEHLDSLSVVDISDKFLDMTRELIPSNSNVKFIKSNWLEFKSEKKFSDVILFRGIDYLPEPKELLKHIKTLLDDDGKLHILIPNNRSIHRLVGFYAGIDNPFELSQNDKDVGHLHTFNLESLTYMLQSSGFVIEQIEGIGLKPLSNAVMSNLDEKIIDAFVNMGNLVTQNSAEIYLVAKCK